jgi:hypothetical protein
MASKTKDSPFSGVRLTGKDAEAFRRQFLSKEPETNISAIRALKKGKEALKQMQKGFGNIILNQKGK